jgi:predicted dehydrogenase
MLTGAIVGFGEVARHGHWPGYAGSTEARIAAVVDRSPARRAVAESLDPHVRTFATIEDLAAAMDVDFIDICTPPSLHPEPMLAGIAQGWHVLCEKPFLLDPRLVARVRELADHAGVAVLPVHNWKYAPIIRAATAALRGGAIGRLRRVEIETCRREAAATAERDHTNWRRDPAVAGGGILMDHGWHAVYLALHWFDGAPAVARASLHHPPQGGVEDEALVTLAFPAGQAQIRLTWNAAVRRNTCRLTGSEGDISIDDDALGIRGVVNEVKTFPRALSAGSHHDDWFAAMLPDVVAAFRQPSLARPLFDEAAACLSVIQEAYRCSSSPA